MPFEAVTRPCKSVVITRHVPAWSEGQPIDRAGAPAPAQSAGQHASNDLLVLHIAAHVQMDATACFLAQGQRTLEAD